MTTAQILIGFGLIILLAVGSQLLASRLRVPALIVLLLAGFTGGALTSNVNPQHLLGTSFQALMSLSVAAILYDAGLGLDLRKLKGHTRKVVIRLIVLGVLITWVLAAALAALLLGMSHGAAVMLGVILVVSGPAVVGPLLGFFRPTERLQRILIWGGSLIDPVGGALGALSNMRGFGIPARRPFFETLVQLIISVLFMSISATVTPQSLRHLILPTLVLVAVLVIVARPVAAFAATLPLPAAPATS